MSSLAIINALIVPMTDTPQSFPGSVRIENGVIAQVSRGTAPDSFKQDEVIDAAGCVLMPGLINAHTHLYQILLRAVWEDLPLLPWLKRIYGTAQVLRPDHFYAGTLVGCIEAIRGGVTTLCEHNFLNPHPECAFETIRALGDSGLRAVFARTIMDTGEIVPECVKENSETAFRHIESILARHGQNKQLSFMTGPNTPPINTTPELLRKIREFANAKAIGISAHVAESKAVVDYTKEKHGTSGVVTFLNQFAVPGRDAVFAHGVHLAREEIAILRQTGTSVSHNPVSNMMLGDGVAPVIDMLRQDVNLALGTDGAASNHSQDLFETMKAASLLQKVHHQNAGIIEPYAVLKMATSGGARALGLSSVCGTIEVGKSADLMLLQMNTVHSQPINDLFSQIVHCARASDVQTVMVNGEVLMKDRALLRLDADRALGDAKAANRDLKERLRTLSL